MLNISKHDHFYMLSVELYEVNILADYITVLKLSVTKKPLVHHESSWLLHNKGKYVSEHELHAISVIKEFDLIKDFKALALLSEKRYAYCSSQQGKIIRECSNPLLCCKMFSRDNSFSAQSLRKYNWNCDLLKYLKK